MGNNGGKPWFEEGPIGDLMEERYYREIRLKEKEKRGSVFGVVWMLILFWIVEKFIVFGDCVEVIKSDEYVSIVYPSDFIFRYEIGTFVLFCCLVALVYYCFKLSK